MVSARLVDAVIAATREHGAAVPVLPVVDTVKVCDDRDWIEATLDRARLRLAQTPQGSRRDWLHSALTRGRSAGKLPTDEASALESDGRKVATVPGERDNLKITTPRDLAQARQRLGGGEMGLRVGSGYDIHRRGGQGRRLMLGGVFFEGQPGLVGHSDADVVLHAAMDALLGAAALGDIGAHFPPEDPRFAGARSTELARQVADMVREAGYQILNVDLTLLAETPKIRTRSTEMREKIADCFGVEISQVGLKATTLEGLGALGRGEGAACQAVALLRRVEGTRE
jgi:2-C-methyl-D-erythritol 2,4-cyclodiphosphate synthase